MTRGGKLLWVAGGCVALLVLGVGVLSTGRVQTRIAQGFLAEQPGAQITLRSLDVGWSSVAVRDLEIRQGPLHVRIPGLRAELPLWSLAGAHKRIDRIEAQGWEVRWDGAIASPAPVAPPQVVGAGWTHLFASLAAVEPAAAPALWEQLTQILNQPLPITVNEVDLAGRTFWREAGPGADGFAEVRVKGRGPGPGDLSRLRIEIDATGARVDARGIQSMSIRNDLTTKLTGARTIERLNLETELVASLGGGEAERSYGMELDLVQVDGAPRVGFALREGDLPLASAKLGSAEMDTQLEGEWSVSLNAMNISHLMLGRELPNFSVDGHGDLSASRSLADAALDGGFTFVVTDVGSHIDTIAGVGDLSGEIDFAVQQSGANTRFTRLDIALAGAAPVLEARLLQGVEIGRDVFELRVANPDKPVCEVELDGLPPAWIQPLLAPWVLDARPVQGKLVGLVSPQGLRVVTDRPIRMERVALAEAGQTWIDDALVEIDLGAEITPEGWQVELGRVEVSRTGSPVITLQARGGQIQTEDETVKVVGRLEADLVGLTAWPGFAGSLALGSGRLTAEFGVGLDDRISVATAIMMDELAGADGMRLPSIEMDGRVDLLAEGGIEVHLPSTLERDGRSSEITLNLRTEPQQGGMIFEGSLSSPVLYTQDLQDFAALIPETEAEAVVQRVTSPRLSPVQVNPASPIWGATRGTMQVSVGKVVVPNAPSLERVATKILLDGEGVKIPQLAATIGEEGTLTATGALVFHGENIPSYTGTAEVELSDIAVEPWLRWFDPDELPVLTGRVNLNATWEGTSSDPRELADVGVLQARVTSGGGVIRALGVEVDSYIQTGQTVATLGALFGAVTGNQQLQQHSQRIKSATDAAALLAAVTFDQLSLNVDRGLNGDIVLSDLSLISPNLRLLGDGKITYRSGFPFWVQPLELSLSLAARDELGGALENLGLLNAEADSLGYFPLVQEFSLDGSLANIGTSQLQQLLVRALR